MITNKNKSIGIYIHIPFCEKKCPYCDFYSIKYNEHMVDMYIESICDSIKNWSQKIHNPIDTVYLGGGTPSIIGENRLYKIISTIFGYLTVENPEITIEINPTKGKLLNFEYLKKLGINRLSVGLQSANINELIALGRSHDSNDVKFLMKSAQKSGIDNISLDLMLAIPFQTNKSLKNSINFCKSIGATHISAYLLKVEKGTLFYKNQSELNLPNENDTVNLYFTACEELEKNGFIQYEISNFSISKKESKHNLKYWNCEEYLGIGPSAHSFINNKRFYYKNSLKSFINKEKPIQDGMGSDMLEYSMLKLRLSKGLKNNEFKKRFSQDIPKKYYANAKKYENCGLVIITENTIKLTRKGFIVSNELISEIIL